MILRTLNDVFGTAGETHNGKCHSFRLLSPDDGMGLTITDSILEEGFEATFPEGRNTEAFYCLEGEGTIEDLHTGTTHPICPGTLFVTANRDHHRIEATTRMRLIRATALS
jgi:L-ectoine synthase